MAEKLQAKVKRAGAGSRVELEYHVLATSLSAPKIEQISLDRFVEIAIQEIDPSGSRPDEETFVGKRSVKAPDHLLNGDKFLIERKSINDGNITRVGEKLVDEARRQGRELNYFGSINVEHIISILPDPSAARRIVSDVAMRQLRRNLQDSASQFRGYTEAKGVFDFSKAVIISDMTSDLGETAFIEKHLRNLLDVSYENNSVFNVIDAVIYIKEPSLVWEVPNGHWFKCVIRPEIDQWKINLIKTVASEIYSRMRLGPWKVDDQKFRSEYYRPVFAGPKYRKA